MWKFGTSSMCNGTCSKMIQFKEIMKPQNNMWASYCLFSPSIHLFDFFFSINWFLIPHFRYKISENQVKYPTTSSQGDVFKCWVLSNQHKKGRLFFYYRPIAETMFGNEELTPHIWSHGDDWIYMWGDKASGAQPHVTCFRDLMWNRGQFVWIPPL